MVEQCVECDFLELETYENDERLWCRDRNCGEPSSILTTILSWRSVARFEVNGRATFLRRTGLCYEVTRLTIRERAYF